RVRRRRARAPRNRCRRWSSARRNADLPERLRNPLCGKKVLRFACLDGLANVDLSGETYLMALSSMTGFARSHGASGPYTFEWELKSVNAKGFDLRVRLPQGFDELEAYAKKRVGEVLSRGTVYANLNVKRSNAAATVRINEDVLNAVLKVAAQ